MLGSQQLSDWQKGSSIIWKKDFNGRKFVDKGEILEITPQKSLKYNTFVQHYNRSSRPFVWTATADSILQNRPTLFAYFRDTTLGLSTG
jgi:hypothetical protein